MKEIRWDRPHKVVEINPDGARIFKGRVCLNCRKSIMSHWILNFKDTTRRAEYYCHRDGTQVSEGMSNGF